MLFISSAVREGSDSDLWDFWEIADDDTCLRQYWLLELC